MKKITGYEQSLRLQSRLQVVVSIFILVFTITYHLQPTPSYAQSLSTQKQVISTFKTDVNQYFPFRGQTCDEKSRGDANCDGLVDLFDLSIWQVEVNNPEGSRRADFNNDGVVNLADFGIWKTTYYPQSVSLGSEECSGIVKLLHCYIAKAQMTLTQQFNNLTIQQSVFAQQADSQSVRHSLPITFSDGSSMVFNASSDGTGSQINFDQNSNLVSSLILNSAGNVQAESNFVSGGDEVVSTTQDGITIQTIKKADGPVIQSFKDGSNNILAVKSWPTLASLENNEPPLAVTVPSSGNNLMTLNISPNGTGIIVQTDPSGNILNQAQYKPDGTYLSQDNRFNINTQSNNQIGLSTIELPNNLGGKTTYDFYKSGLFAIVQTDKNNNYYIAKPVDASGDSWNLSSTVNGQTTETITTDPVAQIGSTSPNAKEMIQNINYYKALPKSSNAINFQDGFGNNPQIPAALLTQGNEILRIQSYTPPQTQATSYLFAVKEALAASDTAAATAASAASVAPSTATGNQVQAGIGNNTADVTVASDGSQSTTVSNAEGAQVASSTSDSSGNTKLASDNKLISTIASVISTTSSDYGTTPIGRPSVEQKGPTTCFLAGTLISTPTGPKAIETLKPGDKVYSYNEKTGAKEVSDFKALDINFVDDYLIINNKIQTTTYHPFYVLTPSNHVIARNEVTRQSQSSNVDSLANGNHQDTEIAAPALQARNDVDSGAGDSNDEVEGNRLLSLVKAGTLKIGDFLVDEEGRAVPITSIQKVPQKATVYNLLTVTPNDNFYAAGVLVHNYQDHGIEQVMGNNGGQNPQGESWSDYSSTLGSTDSNTNSAPADTSSTNTQSTQDSNPGSVSGPDNTVGSDSSSGGGNEGNSVN